MCFFTSIFPQPTFEKDLLGSSPFSSLFSWRVGSSLFLNSSIFCLPPLKKKSYVVINTFGLILQKGFFLLCSSRMLILCTELKRNNNWKLPIIILLFSFFLHNLLCNCALNDVGDDGLLNHWSEYKKKDDPWAHFFSIY